MFPIHSSGIVAHSPAVLTTIYLLFNPHHCLFLSPWLFAFSVLFVPFLFSNHTLCKDCAVFVRRFWYWYHFATHFLISLWLVSVGEGSSLLSLFYLPRKLMKWRKSGLFNCSRKKNSWPWWACFIFNVQCLELMKNSIQRRNSHISCIASPCLSTDRSCSLERLTLMADPILLAVVGGICWQSPHD